MSHPRSRVMTRPKEQRVTIKGVALFLLPNKGETLGKSNKWETTEGGALPGADGPVRVEITNVSFNYDAAYNNGDTLVFILEGDCDHEHWQGSIIYSIGNGWETDDNETVTGRDAFVQSTNYARFFRAVLATKAEDIVLGRGEPDDASIFADLVFDFEREAYKGFDGEEKFLLLPSKFIGEAGGKKKKKKSKGKASKAGEKDLRKKLVKLAGKHDDHDEFVEAVLNKFPEVEDHDELYESVLEEDGLFEEG